jgi:hypothetical protein
MKTSPRLIALVVRLATVLFVLGATASLFAQAQVSFLQPLAIPAVPPLCTLTSIGTASSTSPRHLRPVQAFCCWAMATALSSRMAI